MKLGIDARMYGPTVGGGGIGRYVQELVRGLQDLDDLPPCTLFVKPENADAVRLERPDTTVRVVDVHWYTLREQLVLPRVMDAENLDLIHVPHWNVPLGLRTPFVVTIHDLILLEEPRSARATTRHPLVFALKQAGFRHVLKHALFASQKIIAVSAYTKKTILAHFPRLPAEKIVVIHEGVTSLPAPDPSVVVPRPYLLAVGNAYPHKNLDTLLAAFRLVRNAHHGVRLALAGRDDVFAKRLLASEDAQALGESIVFVPSPSDAELSSLYQHALAYVYPSRLEGFGLPPLEAMNLGVPVVSSNAGSLPEILGDAALFFNPRSPEEMARAMERLIEDEPLRHDLMERGRRNIERFSWQRMARETLRLYKETLEHTP